MFYKKVEYSDDSVSKMINCFSEDVEETEMEPDDFEELMEFSNKRDFYQKISNQEHRSLADDMDFRGDPNKRLNELLM